MSDRFMTLRAWPALFVLCLAACTAPTRTDPVEASAQPPAANEATPEEPVSPTIVESATADDNAPLNVTTEVAAPALDLWQSIVARHAFVDCTDPAPAVRRWERIYAQSPKRHAEALAESAPWIGYVADELERRGLPSEYVWLPFVESRYHAFRTRGDRPAGAWQMMPTTARWRGLRITDDYDGRLDFVAATDAALDLIEHLAEVFDRDWSLVTMAYNAGEYRIKGALERARKVGKPTRPEQLAVSPITHEHLVKLRALTCIVMHPERVAMTLPAFDDTQQLQPTVVPKAMNVSQLAALSGVSTTQWLLWNPAWRRGHVDAGTAILLPRALLETSIAAISAATPASIERVADTPVNADAKVHVVHSGDSAWTIARRYHVSLAALLSINGLGKTSVLRPGQKLRLP